MAENQAAGVLFIPPQDSRRGGSRCSCDSYGRQPQGTGSGERNCNKNRADLAGGEGFVPLCGNHP